MRKFADVCGHLGFLAELDRPPRFDVAQKQHPDRISGSLQTNRDARDLRRVVVLLGCESGRRVEPVPFGTAERSNIALRDDRDRDMVGVRDGDEAGRPSRRVVRRAAEEEIGEKELTHTALGDKTGHRREVVQIGMGDDRGIERTDARGIKAGNHHRPGKAR